MGYKKFSIALGVCSIAACAGPTLTSRPPHEERGISDEVSTGGAAADQGDTPDRAIQRLESAYRAQDLEAAVAAKDFRAEAGLMLQSLAHEQAGTPDMSQDQEVLTKTAEVLELAFRKQITQEGFPDFSHVNCSIARRAKVTDDLVVVHEICTLSDGRRSGQRLNVARTPKGWRVLNVIE